LLLAFNVGASQVDELGPNEWVDLGHPSPDPVYGYARGRSWTPKMLVTPEGLCLIGAGRHGAVNQDGFYQDDVSCYIPETHSWVMLDPGTHVSSLSLGLDENNFETDLTTGEHDLVAQFGHGYNICSYTEVYEEIFCISNTDPFWESAIPQRYDWLPPGSNANSPTSPEESPWRFNVTTRVWVRDKGTFTDPLETPWNRFEGIVEAVGNKMLYIRHGNIWEYNFETRQWTKVDIPAHSANDGYDHVACKLGDYIYLGKHSNFSRYDIVNQVWEVLSTTIYIGNGAQANLTCDTDNDIVLLHVYTNGVSSLRAYDVSQKEWKEQSNSLDLSSVYRPVINAAYYNGIHWFYAASDSEPRSPMTVNSQTGRMFAYRYDAQTGTELPDIPTNLTTL